jgi:hypothetical protein
MRETRVAKSICPFCDYGIDAASSTHDAVPSPGDVTVCLSCASILILTAEMTVRRPFYGEIAALFATDKPLGDKVRRMQRAVRNIDRRNLTFARPGPDAL